MSLCRAMAFVVAAAGIGGSTNAAEPPAPPIPVGFTLDKPGHVTLVIDTPSAERIRNLVSGEFFPAGDHVVGWDGLDEGRAIPIPRSGAYDTSPSTATPRPIPITIFTA